MTPEERRAQHCLTSATFVRDGDVIEARSFDNGPLQTVSGYFDDPNALHKELERYEKQVKSIFFTLNPVMPALLARRANRMDRNVKETTADADIMCRRWLPVDTDPVRPSGISATDEEKQVALERIEAIRSFLLGYGIHTTKADSGNGGHAHIPIDLPNDDPSRDLCSKVLEALDSIFSDELVSVDTTMFNAARVCAFYGTQKRKGDHTAERPHRYARLFEIPDDLTPVPVETLRQIAALLPVPEPPAQTRKGTSAGRTVGPFDLDQWTIAHGITIKKKLPYKNNGERWQMDCPFNPEHRTPDAALYVFPDGKVGFKCSHKSCAGNHWREFRLLFEPDAYDRKSGFEKMRQSRAKSPGAETGEDEDGAASPEQGSCPYAETPTGIVRYKPTGEGIVPIQLTNFSAKIVATTTIDDGAETSLSFDIEAYRNGRRFAFDVPAKDFSALEWPILKMGPESIVFPGQSAKDHARCAIQVLSGSPEERFQYRHTGWRQIGSQWVYLHADGWIGGEIDGHVSVALEGGTSGYRLPAPVDRAAAREAVRASLWLLDLAPAPIIYPLYAALWRSVVDSSDFAIHLAGATQSGKSTVSALLQQHLGATMNARALPGAWSSTDNALEGMGFAAKDALLTIDDFVPRGGTSETQRLYAKAERVLRAQGNNSGRLRMRADGTLRPVKPPRGLILSTGEDIPPGESLRARMLILEMGRGDLKIESLNKCQENADTGVYAQAMTSFLSWLSPQYEARRQEMREASIHLRDEWGRGELLRTPDILANLAAGFRLFLAFCIDIGVITEKNAHTLDRNAIEALRASGEAQSRHQAANEPAQRYMELLRQAIASGKAYLTNERDGQPEDPASCGWRKEADSRGDYVWKPLGDRIGWITADGVYVMPESGYNVAKRMGDAGGEGISIAPRTLAKRLKERGLLATTDETRSTSTVRKTFGGESRGVRDVLHFSVGSLIVAETDKTDKTDNREED